MTMKNKRLILLIACCCCLGSKAFAQHFVGVTGGYSINSMMSSLNEDLGNVSSWNNYGLMYKYYGGKWVGIQTGINYLEKGYQRDSTSERRYQILEVPFVTQLHYEFWKLRAIANAGVYASYALSADNTTLYPNEPNKKPTTDEYTFSSTDYRFDYGLRFGGGLALMLHPVEIQFEFNYSVGLNFTHKPVNPPNRTVYNQLTQMVFSVGVLIAL